MKTILTMMVVVSVILAAQSAMATILLDEDFDGQTWAGMSAGDANGHWEKGGANAEPRIDSTYTPAPDEHLFMGPTGRLSLRYLPTTAWTGNYTLEFDAYTHATSAQDDIGLYLGRLSGDLWLGNWFMGTDQGSYAITNLETWTVPSVNDGPGGNKTFHHYEIWSGGANLDEVKIWIDGVLNFHGFGVNGSNNQAAPNTGMTTFAPTWGFYVDNSNAGDYLSLNNIVLTENVVIPEPGLMTLAMGALALVTFRRRK